ncbi:hypothetical protein B4135_2317 [Caldibacillus debilis]|uniref:Uncharacterized protein n=1 Tax=Caldibacillus debilis TaxID=301148 RepID=A0A150M3K4_9BACI|nr:hypothetical protein B4135_2317 [Caldibacillus debilis]
MFRQNPLNKFKRKANKMAKEKKAIATYQKRKFVARNVFGF